MLIERGRKRREAAEAKREEEEDAREAAEEARAPGRGCSADPRRGRCRRANRPLPLSPASR